jgi:hypothetical protein
VSLLADLDGFYTEHRRCGELEADIDESDRPSWYVWMTCSCGARLNRPIRLDE